MANCILFFLIGMLCGGVPFAILWQLAEKSCRFWRNS
jgi:hypothetical protein